MWLPTEHHGSGRSQISQSCVAGVLGNEMCMNRHVRFPVSFVQHSCLASNILFKQFVKHVMKLKDHQKVCFIKVRLSEYHYSAVVVMSNPLVPLDRSTKRITVNVYKGSWF